MSKKEVEAEIKKEQKQKQRLIKKQERRLIKEQKQKQRLIKKQERRLIKEQKQKQRLIKKRSQQRLINEQQQRLIKEQQQQQRLIKEQQQQQSKVSMEYLEYKNKMDNLPNDTVLTRWGMYTHDERYKDETAGIVKMIMDDMKINSDQAYYMLYYMVSNNIEDYERAKADMYVDENFEMYKRKEKRKEKRKKKK